MQMSLWKVTHIDAGCHRHRLLLRGMTKEQVQDRAWDIICFKRPNGKLELWDCISSGGADGKPAWGFCDTRPNYSLWREPYLYA